MPENNGGSLTLTNTPSSCGDLNTTPSVIFRVCGRARVLFLCSTEEKMSAPLVELKRAKKTFNVISVALIDQLLKIFGEEPVLMFFRSEIEKFSKDRADDHVPAANFFGTMNVETKLARESDRMSDPIPVGELIIRKDERLFGPETGVVIPALEALGLCQKWPKLSPANKEMVWGYLIRMAQTSTQVVVGMRMHSGMLKQVVQDLKDSGAQLRPGASDAEYAEFARHVRELAVNGKKPQ